VLLTLKFYFPRFFHHSPEKKEVFLTAIEQTTEKAIHTCDQRHRGCLCGKEGLSHCLFPRQTPISIPHGSRKELVFVHTGEKEGLLGTAET